MLTRRGTNTVAIFLLVGLFILGFFIAIPKWAYFLVALVWLTITALGSFLIQWDYHLTSLHSNKSIKENWVSITFDDGPNSEFTPRVLEILQKNGAKATFFCVGERMEKHPEVVKKILAEGHTLGNHTYSHSKSFGFFGTSKVTEELQKTKNLIFTLTNRETALYRPAFGVTNPSIEKAIKKLGLKSIGWSVRSLDTTARTENTVLSRITKKVSKGDIILLHDTSEKTIRVLERLLVFLREKNLQSVTVERLLNLDDE